MSVDFVSVNGLGGAMELGFVQNGMTLRHRAGSLDLGAPLVESNRQLMGWEWEASLTADYRDWPRFDVPIVMGNPPCSAWSTLTRQDLRGGDAKVMRCTAEVFDYVKMMKTPPLIITLESVQQAFSTGRAWYVAQLESLREVTGHDWQLTWVMQSNASLGGCSVRKRVFVTYSRIPFGVEYAQPARVARLGDGIRDLEGLELTSAKQPYRRPATWWSIPMRAEDGVDGHFTVKQNDDRVAILDVLHENGLEWPLRWDTTKVLRTIHELGIQIPMPWAKRLDRLVQTNFNLGLGQTNRWDPDRQAHVLTGGGPIHSIHYQENRLFTYRECARIQGFPDTWRIWPSRSYPHLGSVWGKGVPVHAGNWIGRWCKLAVEGDPGTVRGEPIGPNERRVDLTDTYKRTLDLERSWEHQRWVPHEHGHWTDREHDALCAC